MQRLSADNNPPPVRRELNVIIQEFRNNVFNKMALLNLVNYEF